VRLQPAHPRMVPVYIKRADFRPAMVLGVVVATFRNFRRAA
jgi:hypothetical protein